MNCRYCDTPIPSAAHANRRFCNAECKVLYRASAAPPCSEIGCSAPAHARGLCQPHYSASRSAGAFDAPTCLEAGCKRVGTSKGLCTTHYSRARRDGVYGPAVAAKERDRNRMRLYGLTGEALDQMREAQGQRCAICADDITGGHHVDHDHATGVIRALLCPPCNKGLGHFRDDPALLLAAIDYLTTHKENAA